MTGDDRVHVRDRRLGLRERFRKFDDAAAVFGHDAGHAVPRKKVADVRQPKGREHDDDVAVGVGPTVVEEIDPILAGEQRHLVLEGPRRQALGVLAVEVLTTPDVRAGVPGQVDPRIFMCDELDVPGHAELGIATGVIDVCVRADDDGDRFGSHRFELLRESRGPIPGIRTRRARRRCRG